MSRAIWPIIEKALAETFPAEGERFAPELLPPMTEKQLEAFAAHFQGTLPNEISELLKHTSGFDFYGLGTVRFDRVPGSSNLGFMPDATLLCEDDAGLKWLVNLDVEQGVWAKVFVVDQKNRLCVVQSENLATFISQLFNAAENSVNWLDHIRSKVLPGLKKQAPIGISMIEAVRHQDHAIRSISLGLPQDAMLFDLRESKAGDGFSWGNGIIEPTSVSNIFAVLPEKRPFWRRWFS